jgi:hypothetical protein
MISFMGPSFIGPSFIGRSLMREPTMRSFVTRTFGTTAMLTLLALTGCNQLDPLKRPYMWQATDANAQNIAAMAANPADLTHGQDIRRRRASMDTDAVTRVWTGKTIPLITDTPGAASGGGSSGGATSSGGAS